VAESTIIKQREYRSIVNLKVSPNIQQFAEDTLHLAAPLHFTDNIVKSLWIGPEHWLILSDHQSAREILISFNDALNGKTFNALDYTAALRCFEISGESTPRLMSALSSVDFRPNMFSVGACCRTKVAKISGVVMREAQNQFLIFVDRSFEAYVANLLTNTLKLLTNHPSA
tara:strand:- start:71 stop:583 length:513 start_codon:yes stop_codon:yes gene_type:complete